MPQASETYGTAENEESQSLAFEEFKAAELAEAKALQDYELLMPRDGRVS